MARVDFLSTLHALTDAGVDFIVVGGLAAVLNGAPVDTFNLEIVHARIDANIAKLLDVLHSLEAIYRAQPSRRLQPSASHLASPGHQNLLTTDGPFDILGEIVNGLTYEDLLPDTVLLNVGNGKTIRVLTLEKLISLKEILAGEKDLAALPMLRKTLRER